ncbi:hypothetical protein DFA_08435 [Cavenderia fasciculata]|uniref:Uncharacterized protein n=1 Tax=Cavenderia fasciculata TaxID=261658 RepID=F4Q666_CACFS|nr:uncharacterized protein DFA_08435 [Cavenderia fasciculata]EGG17440.1 hypothetical protein DFA_08435 [Cavenderia fasciculata]|eukprot:XP_004355924.1 hypothetical protein DFA_08435 [Cavenderia fasciculata]
MTSLILKLPNLILSQIISDIDDNADIVCLLLTCKKLYHNISIRRSIKFKGIVPITEEGEISKQFESTATQFKLNSFKDILENSISNSQVIVGGEYNDYPEWIQQRITLDRADNSSSGGGIKTAMAINKLASPQLFYDIPSIETLIIGCRRNTLVDFESISLLPRLERLDIRAIEANIGPHPTLKSLKLDVDIEYNLGDLGLTKFESLTELNFRRSYITGYGPGLLPSSLTSLTIRPTVVPPRDTFLSLTSLVYLKIDFDLDFDDEEEDDVKKPCIDLESLSNLKKLTIKGRGNRDDDFTISISVPPSLKVLTLFCMCVQIPHQCTMPQLEELYVQGFILLAERIQPSLSSYPSLKKLFINDCYEPLPTNFLVPSSLEKLTILKYEDTDILGQVVFPPSLTHLTIVEGPPESIVHQLPESLVKLKMTSRGTLSLPQTHLKKLVWGYDSKVKASDLVFPTTSNYPPHLETLNLVNIENDFTIDIPPITKYLSITLVKPKPPNIPLIFSIGSRITKPPINQQQQQQQWLSPNTTHLTCHLSDVPKGAFRLDEIINHTNVRYLSLVIEEITLKFSIQRLDADNRNVLVLERQSLQGGIITRQRTSINNHQQQYDPIYLYFGCTPFSPFALKWSFGKDSARI